MKIKTSELSDEKLDLAVSIALGHRPEKDFHSHGMTWNGWWETATYIDTKPNEYRRLPKYSGEIYYLLSQSADRITNLETANKEAYKALIECEALVKEYPLVHQWTVAALKKLKELQQ